MQFINRARVALITAGIALAVPAVGFAAPHKSSAHRAPNRSAHKAPKRAAHKAPKRSAHIAPAVSPYYAAWSRVAACEEGGWTVGGYNYPDSLGIDRANYEMFGGTPQPPGPVSQANREVQIRVAERLRARYHISIPDQGGCAAW
jgi:Transglycosylase-like domain